MDGGTKKKKKHLTFGSTTLNTLRAEEYAPCFPLKIFAGMKHSSNYFRSSYLRITSIQGEIIYPPSPPFWLERIFEGEGGECIFRTPPPTPRQEFYTPPLFYTPPPPPLEGYFQGWGVYKIWPPILLNYSRGLVRVAHACLPREKGLLPEARSLTLRRHLPGVSKRGRSKRK